MSWLRLMEESMEINPEAPATGDSEKVHSPLPGKKHNLGGLIREMWPAYLIEIVVIILGISITLALEEWRDNRKENQLEQVYLKNLVADVESDIKTLEYTSNSTKKLLEQGNELLTFTRNPDGKEISYERLNTDIRDILSRPRFTSRDVTFSDLKSSGNLHLLKDIPLKSLLFSYYSETQLIHEIQDAEQQATITLSGAYFLKWFPFDYKINVAHPFESDRIPVYLKSIEFNNNILLRVSNRKELLEYYQMADSLATVLKTELNKKIE
jgi:hypothetical protein